MATISTVAGQDDIFIIQVPGAKVGDMVKVLDMDGAAHKMQLVPPIGSAHAACSPVAAAPHAPRTATMCEGRRGNVRALGVHVEYDARAALVVGARRAPGRMVGPRSIPSGAPPLRHMAGGGPAGPRPA